MSVSEGNYPEQFQNLDEEMKTLHYLSFCCHVFYFGQKKNVNSLLNMYHLNETTHVIVTIFVI